MRTLQQLKAIPSFFSFLSSQSYLDHHESHPVNDRHLDLLLVHISGLLRVLQFCLELVSDICKSYLKEGVRKGGGDGKKGEKGVYRTADMAPTTSANKS